MFKKILNNGVETNYSISSEGEVRNDKTNKLLTVNKSGVVQMSFDGKNVGRSVAKLVAEYFLPKTKPTDKYLAHIDGDMTNNNVNNLLWISDSENSKAVWEKRRQNQTTGAGQKKGSRKRENIVEDTNYTLQDNEKQIFIDDFPTYYSINTDGQVRNLKSGYILKGSLFQSYQYVNLTYPLGRKNKAVHQLVAQAFLSNPENKKAVDHIDGDRLNNKLENLRWVTSLENAQNRHPDKTPKRPALPKEPFTEEELASEEWKEYKGYKVSNLGRVIGKKGALLSGGVLDCGYIGYGNHILGHLLVWEAFNGEKLPGYVINHINGNKQDNRLSNLEMVTHQENLYKAANETNAWGFRKVGEFSPEGELLRTFSNASDAARAIGILPGSMRNSIRRGGKCYNGLEYRYLELK